LAARILAAAAAVLAIAALVYPLWLKREAVIALHPRLDKARAGADVAERLGKEIEKLAAEHNFVLGKKHAQVPVVTLMEDLSRLLPDTTWVQQLDVKSGAKSREIQLAGETGSSSQLIEVLERSGTFANASFKSPLTKGVTPGTERFLLVAEVKPRPLPEPVPEDALAATAAAKARPAAPPSPAPAPATAIVTPAPAQAAGAQPAPPLAKPAAAGAPEEKD
jgi:general secretion pathway protein L